jgi:hypothetical protein
MKSFSENERNLPFVMKKVVSFLIHTTMITTYGVKHNQYWGNIQSEVTFEDIYNE